MRPWRGKSALHPADRRLLLLGFALLPLLIGCSGSGGPDRVPLGGRVTVAGSPVAEGTVSFLPAEGRSGPAATAVIQRGRYQFSTSDGPLAGPHQVVVSLPAKDKGRFLRQVAPSAKPSKSRWETHLEVPAAAPFQCDIALD